MGYFLISAVLWPIIAIFAFWHEDGFDYEDPFELGFGTLISFILSLVWPLVLLATAVAFFVRFVMGWLDKRDEAK